MSDTTRLDETLARLNLIIAERDAALAAVTAVRSVCDQLVAERSTAGAGVIANRIRAALGTVGQPQEDACPVCTGVRGTTACCPSCEQTRDREDPNGE